MGNLTQILPLILMFVLFYFLLIRPQQKRQKATRNMQSSLKKGDKVATIGGMHGTIDAIDELQIVIKSPDGSKLTFDRAAIREITESAPNKEVTV
ncbi:preprotein translocase subunit YajC [Peribacillus sp. NPDC060186]|uniref:Preprotein translocase subunit YajC n=1 Tax=Peribacillus butanolivorans TaxID=421767 RepID=A0AAX0RQE3_9BACI|nr:MULTISPECIES: preprotein translocase subunit YajC [Peribacillus]AXN37698.1 preprotein translocase subunit YajC [Peribacillus butanolivorans]MBK5442752.1 preprotein translocase subunit YajC [Peribacillus sp. TH24]MBK5484157.1 preprotein translocase subunit YajC [Peribacillus sp. TH16]PEJ25887.1 preprotein translocase subunit YajC [Peribacillus butanolivorans]WMX54324.1 preprotein translocase subunit YajC [Peribacillus sp. R9-11]